MKRVAADDGRVYQASFTVQSESTVVARLRARGAVPDQDLDAQQLN